MLIQRSGVYIREIQFKCSTIVVLEETNCMYIHNSITVFTNNESSREGTSFDKCIGLDRNVHFNEMDPPAPLLVAWAPLTPRSTFNNLLPVTWFFRWVNIAGCLFMIFFAEESQLCRYVSSLCC